MYCVVCIILYCLMLFRVLQMAEMMRNPMMQQMMQQMMQDPNMVNQVGQLVNMYCGSIS